MAKETRQYSSQKVDAPYGISSFRLSFRTRKKFHRNHAHEGYGKIWGSVGSNVGAGHLSTLTLLQNLLIFTLTLLQKIKKITLTLLQTLL